MKIRLSSFRSGLQPCWIVLVFLLLANLAAATTVRGRLFLVLPSGQTLPAPGVAVTLRNPQAGRSTPAYSGSDGMYYLNAPPGSYVLEVWNSADPRIQPLQMTIQVRNPYTDIPPIRVR